MRCFHRATGQKQSVIREQDLWEIRREEMKEY